MLSNWEESQSPWGLNINLAGKWKSRWQIKKCNYSSLCRALTRATQGGDLWAWLCGGGRPSSSQDHGGGGLEGGRKTRSGGNSSLRRVVRFRLTSHRNQQVPRSHKCWAAGQLLAMTPTWCPFCMPISQTCLRHVSLIMRPSFTKWILGAY